MRALWARSARARFSLFAATVTFCGAILTFVLWLTLGIPHHRPWWTVLPVTVAYAVVGVFFGRLLFLSDGDGLRR